jgi:hypothetical protein
MTGDRGGRLQIFFILILLSSSKIDQYIGASI